MTDLRRYEEGIVVRLENVDVDMTSPVTPMREDQLYEYLNPIIKHHLNAISIAVHELFPDAQIIRTRSTGPRHG
jgi:hypothetical protein